MKRIPKKVKSLLWTSLCLIVGNILLAFLVAAFVIPKNVLMGGSTGISILITNAFGITDYTWLVTLGLNIIFLILGLIFLGKKFFFTTIVSSILYPILLGIFQKMPWIENISDNMLLSALLGGALLGMAIGVVMRVGASSGGTDALVLILHKYFHLPVAVFVYVTDAIILIGQTIVFKDWTPLCYGVVLLVVETIVLNKVMILGKSQIQLFVVSSKYDEVREALLTKLDAGVTMALIQTGQFGIDQKAVMCVIPPRKLYSATQIIHSIDPRAFITITEIKEVQGLGFTEEKVNRRIDKGTNADTSPNAAEA